MIINVFTHTVYGGRNVGILWSIRYLSNAQPSTVEHSTYTTHKKKSNIKDILLIRI